MQFDRHAEAAAVLRGLRQLVHALRVTAHSAEHKLGLSGAQLFVLGELALEPNVSIRRVAERTMTDPSSVSVVVARLIERGLVKRRQDPSDKRRSVLSVTVKGQAVLRAAPEPYQAKLFRALHALPRQRLKQLQVGLSALLQASGVEEPVPLFFEGVPSSRSKAKRRVESV